MITGDFLQCDALCTVFFVDMVPNVIAYVETIYQVIRKGWVWVNLGSLLWHWKRREMSKRGAGNKGSESGDGIEVGGSVGGGGGVWV